MNEHINLTEILKYCPVGWKLYSSVLGEVSFKEINDDEDYPITVDCEDWGAESFTPGGKLYRKDNGECLLFPSKDQRDWGKFSTYWYNNNENEKEKIEPNKKEKFDPKTFQPFDRVLGCLVDSYWKCDIFSNIIETAHFPYKCSGDSYIRCIPYNDETKHLVGTTDAAPDFYRYWEN